MQAVFSKRSSFVEGCQKTDMMRTTCPSSEALLNSQNAALRDNDADTAKRCQYHQKRARAWSVCTERSARPTSRTKRKATPNGMLP